MELVLKKTVFILLLCCAFSGCKHASETKPEMPATEKNMIQISREQFEANKMEECAFAVKEFKNEVKCNGYIIAPPGGKAQISTQIPGIVESISLSLGDKVKKGQVLCRLSSFEFIDLQQEYATSSALLKQLKSDFERKKYLYEEKVESGKGFIKAESDYLAMKAENQALKLQLKLLKLDTDKIQSGMLYSSFPVLSPVNGHITSLDVSLGKYVEQQSYMMEIIDGEKLQLKLSIFENDIRKCKIGQSVEFYSSGNPGSIHTAILRSVGETINMQSKTIECIAEINDIANDIYIDNSYIEAKVIVDKTMAPAVPHEAILKSGNDYFVFAIEKFENETYSLRKIKVDIGRKSDKYTEIINPPEVSRILCSGVYQLN